MQVLIDNPHDSEQMINNQIRSAFANVSDELSKLNHQSLDSTKVDKDKILEIYIDVIRLLNNFQSISHTKIDYWTSLVKFTTFDLSPKQTDKLLCVMSLLLIQSLINPFMFEPILNTLRDPNVLGEISRFLEKVVLSDMMPVTDHLSVNNIDNWLTLVEHMDTNDVFPKWACFKFLNTVVNDIDSITKPMDTLMSFPPLAFGNVSVKREMTVILESLVTNLLKEDLRTLSAVLIVRWTVLDKVQEILQRGLSDSINSYCKIINYVIIDMFSYNNFQSIILSKPSFKPLFSQNQMRLPTSELSEQNLKVSIQFMLECLNHSACFENKMNLIYLSWSFNQVFSYSQLPYGRANIYTVFNKLHPKVSVLSVLQLLNIKLLSGIYMSSKKTIPDLLRMFLQEFQSPPFPKEGYLLDVFKNENPVDLELIKENDHLGENLVKSLRLMLMFFQDDLEVPLTDSGSLNSKLSVVKIKRLFELVILNGFELLELEASIITHSGLHYNTCIITSLLNTDLSAVGVHSKTIWCIYNEIVNSFSKADLRYLPLFALFYNQILIKFADSDILQDWLVKRHIVEHFKVFMFDAEKYPAIVQFTGINSYDNSPVIVSQDNFKDIGPDISTKNSSFSGDVSSDFSHMSLSRTQSQFSINTGKQPQPQQEGYQYYQEASNYQDQLPPLQQPQPSVALPFKFADIQFP